MHKVNAVFFSAHIHIYVPEFNSASQIMLLSHTSFILNEKNDCFDFYYDHFKTANLRGKENSFSMNVFRIISSIKAI